MNVLSIPVLMSASICGYVGIYHFLLYLKEKKEYLYLFFAFSCLFVSLYNVFSAGLYNCDTYLDGIFWQRLQFTMINLFFISLSWFIYFFVDYKKKTLFYIFTAIGIFFILIEFILYDSDLTLSLKNPSIKNIEIGTFLKTTYYEVEHGIILAIQTLLESAIFILFLSLLVKRFWKEKNFIQMIISLFIFVLACVNDAFVGMGLYNFIYILEYSFVLIIFSMAGFLLNRFINLKSEVEELNLGLELKVKKRTQELESVNKKLKDLDKLKNDFIANLSHDFRSPLSSIMNTADLALKFNEDLDNDNLENYNIIYKSSLRLYSSIEKLLDLAKMDAKGLKLSISQINIHSILIELIDFYKSAVYTSGIIFTSEFENEFIDDLYSDKDKLEDILNNIFSNAIKFVDHKNGVIEVSIIDKKESVLIKISDNGIGIPVNKINSIFNRFEQVEDGKSSIYKGSGIGLAYAKKLTQLIKGNIWAHSEGLGKGADFYIELKKGKTLYASETITNTGSIKTFSQDQLRVLLEDELMDKNMKSDKKIVFSDLNKENEFDYKKGKILIVDDNSNIRNIVAKYLSNYGYKNFLLVSNGKDAIEVIYEHSPDIIISDYNMPFLNGEKLHEEVSSNPAINRIPFLFLTAIADYSSMIKRKQKGAVAYLKKPINEKELIITVDQNLQKYMEFEKVLYLSIVDELTELYNRRGLRKVLKTNLSKREYNPISLIFLDIDYFKEINDTYGHQAGDLILSNLGQLLSEVVRESDIIGRYGGEEFILAFPGTNINDVKKVAEKIRTKISEKVFFYDDKKIQITTSMGISSLFESATEICEELDLNNLEHLFTSPEKSGIEFRLINNYKDKILDLLIKGADDALYEAKSTICIECNFKSNKKNDFIDNICPQCKSKKINAGRNKVILYESDKS